MEDREIKTIRDAVSEIEKVLNGNTNNIKNPVAIDEISKQLFKIKLNTIDSYILEKVGSIRIYSAIVFSARKHLKYPLARHQLISDCWNISSRLNYLERSSEK